MALTAKQRQFLKRLAHPLSPTVRVGKGGVTESVIEETRRSLDAHELIKVRLDDDKPDARKTAAGKLADQTGSEIAGTIGKIVILYRARTEKPKMKLPEA